VRSLPCCHCGRTYAVQAHHSTHSKDGGGKGMALKVSDAETIPLCVWCHHDFHTASGEFKGWDKEKRHSWQDTMVKRFSSKSDPSFF
jgi:hypothetical protein